jgi:glycosyltransferase involved in cell wall biosynthesis
VRKDVAFNELNFDNIIDLKQKVPPLITIIVAVYNAAKTLEQCINSIANQSYLNKELIIIDGGSSDGSVNLLLANNKKIDYWISETDKGIYSAWNKGLLHASGEWICFLGADDYFWDSHVLEGMVKGMSSLPSYINVAYGQVMLLTKEGQKLYPIGKPWPQVRNQFTKYMSIPHPGLMHRRSLFNKNGIFDESFRIVGDYELLLRELKNNGALFMPLILAGVRQGGVSCNPENSISQLMEVKRAQYKNGYYIPSFFWLFAVIRLIIRKIIWSAVGEVMAKRCLDFLRRLIGLPDYWSKL